MLLVVVDRSLDAAAAEWAVEAVVAGLRAAAPEVVRLAEPGIGATGVSRRPVVMVLDGGIGSGELAAPAAAAAEVVCVAAAARPGLRDSLGLGSGRVKPLWLLLVCEDRPDATLAAVQAGADRVRWVAPVPSKRSVRALRRMGRRLLSAAADAPGSDALGAGAQAAARRRLDDLLEADGVEEFQIMGDRFMVVHYADQSREVHPSPFDSEKELIDTCRHLAAFGGQASQRFDPLDPRVDMQLGRWRLHAEGHVVWPPTMVLRSNQAGRVAISDLGVCDDRLGRVLVEAVAGDVRANVVIAAPMSGGKTTLAQSLLGEVPHTERIDTIEDTPELRLAEYGIHPQAYERLTRDANNDGFGRHTMADHIRDAKRANSDKLVVGEVRGVGTMALLDAMSSGLSGCMVTIHAHPGRGVLDKLISYASFEGAELSYARLLIAGAVDLLVWMGRDEADRRVIGDVTQITGFDEATGWISTRCLWRRVPGRRWAVPVGHPLGRIEELYKSAGVHGEVAHQIEAARSSPPPVLAGQMAIEDAGAATPTRRRGR